MPKEAYQALKEVADAQFEALTAQESPTEEAEPETELEPEPEEEVEPAAEDTGEEGNGEEEAVEPGPVPYDRFKEINERMKAAEEQNKRLLELIPAREPIEPEPDTAEEPEEDSLEAELREWQAVEPMSAVEELTQKREIRRIEAEIAQQVQTQQQQYQTQQAVYEFRLTLQTIEDVTGVAFSESDQQAIFNEARSYLDMEAAPATRKAYKALKDAAKLGGASPAAKAADPSLRPVTAARTRIAQNASVPTPGSQIVEQGMTIRDVARAKARELGMG